MTEPLADEPGRDDDLDAAGSPHRSRDVWPAKRLHVTRGRRIGNRVVTALTGWGVIPHTYLLTTRGRKTNREYSTPVSPVEKGGSKWLVAPYGPVPWVLNARAAGRVRLSRRGTAQDYLIRELQAAEAGPVLKSYIQFATATKAYFQATKDSPVQDFVAEAHHHPVFALTEVASP